MFMHFSWPENKMKFVNILLPWFQPFLFRAFLNLLEGNLMCMSQLDCGTVDTNHAYLLEVARDNSLSVHQELPLSGKLHFAVHTNIFVPLNNQGDSPFNTRLMSFWPFAFDAWSLLVQHAFDAWSLLVQQ
jgi:hypothetical protein